MSVKVEFSSGDAVLLHNLLAVIARRNPPGFLASDIAFMQDTCKKLNDAIHEHDNAVIESMKKEVLFEGLKCPASKKPWDNCTCPACNFPKPVVYDVCKLLRADYSSILDSLDMSIDAKIGYFMMVMLPRFLHVKAAACSDEQLIETMKHVSDKNLPISFSASFFRSVLLQEGMLP